MSQRILESFFSILLLAAVSTAGIAQKKKVDPIDTVKHRYLPTGVRFGFDAIGPIKSIVTKSDNKWTGWEANADIDFDRYYLALEYGSWARSADLFTPRLAQSGTPSIYTGHYTNDGTYFRIGSDINFMLKDPERNMFFLGFRYGTAYHFTESVSYTDSVAMSTTTTTTVPPITTITTLGNNAFQVKASNSNLVAHWIELTTGLRVKIWGPFWMGYTARLKLGITVKGDKNFNTFDVPGYGLAEKGNTWGINYQLFWRFPVRKSPPIKPRG